MVVARFRTNVMHMREIAILMRIATEASSVVQIIVLGGMMTLLTIAAGRGAQPQVSAIQMPGVTMVYAHRA